MPNARAISISGEGPTLLLFISCPSPDDGEVQTLSSVKNNLINGKRKKMTPYSPLIVIQKW